MYLTIKRKDSVSSILLFFFNVFLVERGIVEIPLKKIFRLLEPFQKNETAIRMGLSREIQNGQLVNVKHGNEIFYRITDSVIEGFKHWMKTMDFNREKIDLQLADWDGTWSVMALEDQAAKKEGAEFFESLNQWSFGCFNKSMWISPYHFPAEMKTLLDKFITNHEYTLFASRLAGSGKPETLVRKIWPVGELALRYRQFLDQISESTDQADHGLFKDGGELPALYRFGLDYFEIIQDDPRLPLKILPPDWPGLEAVQSFNRLREKLLPGARKFVNGILEQN